MQRNTLNTFRNVPIELEFTSTVDYGDPFNEIELDVAFQEPGGRELVVPGFWAGGNTWKVRYASPVEGRHSFVSRCSDEANEGLHGKTGAVTVTEYTGDSVLYKHGPIRVTADGRHLEHIDGAPFLWLGEDVWFGFAGRLKWPVTIRRSCLR